MYQPAGRERRLEASGDRTKPGGDHSLTFQVGDVHQLSFADSSFDGCRADCLFMHVEDRQQALREMIRVTRPNGRILQLRLFSKAPDELDRG